MNYKEPTTSVNSSEKTVVDHPERTVAAPHFDSVAVEQARPAVPLSKAQSNRSWFLTLIVAAAIAGLAGGVIGSVLTTSFLRRDAAQAPSSNPAPFVSETDEAVDVPDDSVTSQIESEAASVGEPYSPPASVDRVALEKKADDIVEREAFVGKDRRRDESNVSPHEPSKTENAALRTALGDWVAATNARDIRKQMSFYSPVVNAFYLARNATLDFVRADKARAFSNADSISVRVGSPQINLSPDGRSATMRFRKRYAIAGGGEDRKGEVLQELRWQLIDGNWRIVSERDIRVVR